MSAVGHGRSWTPRLSLFSFLLSLFSPAAPTAVAAMPDPATINLDVHVVCPLNHWRAAPYFKLLAKVSSPSGLFSSGM